MKQKILSMLLAVTVVFTSIDITALAALPESETQEEETKQSEESGELPETEIEECAENHTTKVIETQDSTAQTEENMTEEVTEKVTATNVNAACADVVYKNKKGNWKTKLTLADVNGKKLSANKDYRIVSYKKADGTELTATDILNVNDKVTAIVEGCGDFYTGTKEITYRIAASSISKAKLKLVSDRYYTGKELKPGADDIKITIGTKTLEYDKDYIITGYSNNIRPGNAAITIQGIGEYGGSKNLKFRIKKQMFKFFE